MAWQRLLPHLRCQGWWLQSAEPQAHANESRPQWRPVRVVAGLAALSVPQVVSSARPQAYASDSRPHWLRDRPRDRSYG